MKNLVIAITLIVVLGACTTSLKTEHVSVNGEPKPGILYNLPMAAFDVEAKFLITSCIINSNDLAQISYRLSDATIQHKLAPDSLETYRLDYGLLNSALKTTTVSITMHPNGMIKAVNADVDDRTAQVVTSLAGTVLNIYKASTLSFVPNAGGSAKECDKFLLAKIDKRRDLIEKDIPNAKADDKALSDDKQTADDINLELEEAKSKLAEAQKAKDNVAIGVATKDIAAAQSKLAIAIGKLKDRKFKVPVLQANLLVLTDALTATAKLQNWAPRPPGPEVCQKFEIQQSDFIERLAEASNAKVDLPPAPTDSFSADVCVTVSPNPRVAASALDKTKEGSESNYDGVVYRLPSTGTVSVRASKNKNQRIYSADAVSLPQFGAKGLVWLKNEMFDKNNVKASFNEDGSISELTFNAQSQAERAASAASDVSKSIVDLMQLRFDAIKAKSTAADAEQKKAQQKQIDTLDNQIALLEKRKALEAARNPTKDSYDKQKDQLQKEIDVEKLRQELDALKKKALQS
jgi:hypothetical protein